MVRNFLKRLRKRFIEARIELNLTLVDFLDSRRKTLLRRHSNLTKQV